MNSFERYLFLGRDMNQSDQYVTGRKPYPLFQDSEIEDLFNSFFQDSEIEDWFIKKHTLSYLKFKLKILPLEKRIYKCEILNSEMEEEISELIKESYSISKKLNSALDNFDGIYLRNSVSKPLLLIIKKLISFFFQSSLSLFPIISMYALFRPLTDQMPGTYSFSITIAAILGGFSLSRYSSSIVQSYSYFYRSELRSRNINPKLFLLLASIIATESLIGVYGISYLIEQNRLTLGLAETVKNQVLFLVPTLFSLINVSYSFGEGMKQPRRLRITHLTSRKDTIHQLIEDLRDRIEKNSEELHFYRKEYNEVFSSHKELFDCIDAEKDSVKSLYSSTSKADQANDGLHSKLTVYESADILNVSIPYVINLIESGNIPSQREGTNYYIDLNDLLVYKQESDIESRHALAELAREAQELDMGY